MSILFWHSTGKIINIVHFWFCINYDIFFTFFSKQILILCLSTFVLKHCMWKRILTSSGCQKMAWLKTLSRSLKNTSRPGDCWYVEGWNALVICLFLILLLCWKSLCAMLGFFWVNLKFQSTSTCVCVCPSPFVSASWDHLLLERAL